MNSVERFLQSGRRFWEAARYPELKHAFTVHSHLTNQERIVLYEQSLRAARVAEIGSYIGASACCFGAAALARGGAKVVCIDTWNNDAMTEGHRDTWAEFTKNTEQYASFLVPVRGLSTTVVESVRSIVPSIDVLFIDGDHSYEGVKADWEAYKSFLAAGSTVIFHDYGWAEGVQRVIEEDVRPLVKSVGQLPNMWWASLKSVP